MATNRSASVTDDSASELLSQYLSDLGRVRSGAPPTPQIIAHRVDRHPSVTSDNSQASFGSTHSGPNSSLVLNQRQVERLRKFIDQEYEALRRSEASFCYFLNDRSKLSRAYEQLEKAMDGTFFVRPTFDEKFGRDARYVLHFVCHKEIAAVPICCESEHRKFWFLSGYGHGSEVKLTYSGVDLMIKHKQANRFSELQYPFQICLHQSLNSSNISFVPLPDQLRGTGSRSTIIHEFATRGLTGHFTEIIRKSRNDTDPMREKSLFIVNKINARNERGQTPLILAILKSNRQFIECLLDNQADVNMLDTEGCSPLQHACRQANARILQKLISRYADPFYINPRKSNDGFYQSNLSAFHYLAMANKASPRQIKRCVDILLEWNLPLMPMTSDGKTPFEIAEFYNNRSFDCVKELFARHQYNHIYPIEVSSSSDAKTILANLTCPGLISKFKMRLNSATPRDCLGLDGLFLIYRTKQTKSNPQQQLGLCLHYRGKIYLFHITQKYQYTMRSLANGPTMTYRFSLVPDVGVNEYARGALFRSCEELCYCHTKYQGILPCFLECFVRKENNDLTVIDAKTIAIPIPRPLSPPTSDSESDRDESMTFDADQPKSIDPSMIYHLDLLHENHHRLICLAKVRLNDPAATSLSIVIKDYLPETHIDEYKRFRLNRTSSSSSSSTLFRFSERVQLEYKHESNLLLKELNAFAFIVHAFKCEHRPENDVRLFMEYLPMGNLHTYLTTMNSSGFDPWSNSYHWIYQLAQAMAYLAAKKIVHRDLAARNILLRDEQHIKLSDFGLSRAEGMPPETGDCILPLRWTAPECFERNQNILSISDVWSFGVVIWEIYSLGALPYSKEINSEAPQLIRLLKNLIADNSRRLAQPEHCSDSMYDLMLCCWNLNLNERPKFTDIIEELNNVKRINHRVYPFQSDEQHAWLSAKNKYISITQSTMPMPSGPEYVPIPDLLPEDLDNIVTKM